LINDIDSGGRCVEESESLRERWKEALNRLQAQVFEKLWRSEQFERGLEAVLGNNNLIVSKFPGSSLSLFAAALARKLRRIVFIVTPEADRAEQIFADLEFFGIENAFHFPEDENLPYEFDEPALEILAKQIETYAFLSRRAREARADDHCAVIVTSLGATLRKTFPLETFDAFSVRVEVGGSLDLDDLSQKLVEAGYIRVPLVETRGEFAVRGGVVDVFPLDADYPLRLDLFGNRVETIRRFDPSTQRSLGKAPGKEVVLTPAKKYLLVERVLEAGEHLASLPSLLPAEGCVFLLDEPERFEKRAEEFAGLVERRRAEREKSGEDAPPPERLFESFGSLERLFGSRRPRVEHHLVDIERPIPSGWVKATFRAGVFDALKPHFETFLGIIRESLKKDHLVVIACDNDGQAQRFEDLLRERAMECTAILSKNPEASAFDPPAGPHDEGRIVLAVGPLNGGFLLPEAGLLFLTDREVFGRYKRRRLYRKLYRGTPISSVAEIQRGDYVVHVDHGIGRFVGLRRQKVDGRETDLIEIVYQDGDRLLVPVEKIALVQKYSAVEGAVPALDKLGGRRWIQRKRKSQEAIEKMAQELLDLYARRAMVKRPPYGPDTVWQSEFEASFLYKETPDQWQAIADVKTDLARPIPMDRLICGDVGYGKTEVAMRAAFKVVQEHRQVAVLVPTTILAQQHYSTFRERFATYDVRIEMLSRFRSRREQREILRRLRLGEIDIIVGTHRLLSSDVEFADLGLVVIDEEHRFGVRHKEKLKQLRASVDVLTLTATPIPRTLHMALSGLRDMSVINTPPADRLPIRTHIIHFEEDLIREAVLREINRGGQVFFVHNRVHNIDIVARRLQEIVPQASIAIAHGQMSEHELERVMLDFVAGKYDILVSTTIIESGLDIPNVNTIIINRADALGLAQLYQLRGRVGRSARQAYAYLVVPHGQPITDSAVRRLAAIQEFVDLGAGFQIAMRDMEIRGTGNILGREQHGAMMAVGFELYCDLLQKAVAKLKGEAPEAEVTAEIKWAIDAYIPQDYVPLESQRLAVYKRLAQVRSLRAVRDIEEELRDRFGRLPPQAQALVELAALRVAASRCAVRRVVEMPRGLKLDLASDGRPLIHRLERVRASFRSVETIRFGSSESVEIAIRPPAPEPLAKLREAVGLLASVAEQAA